MNITGVLSAVFWGLLLLSLLVVVHEAGHFFVARAFGVRVTEFFLGLPCRLKLSHKSKKRGTEVGVTPLLLGGYNRICGMECTDDDRMPQAFAIVQREGRVAAEDLAAEMGIEVDEAYTLLVGLSDLAAIRPYYNPELGEKPTQRSYPEAFETVARDANLLTEYDKNHDFEAEGFTAGGAPRPLSDPARQLEIEKSHTYAGCNYPKRLAMLFAGPLVNLVLAFVLVVCSYMSMEFQKAVNENVIGTVAQDSIAEASGLLANDKVLSVAGNPTSDWMSVRDALRAACAAGQDFDVVYERDGAQATAHIDLPDEGAELIGVEPQYEPYHLTLAEASQDALLYAQTVGSYVARLIMPQHTMEVLNSSTSVVGISVMASQAANTSLLDFVALMAAISMSLGFMNLLPIPPLDGGKILIETIGAIRRKPLTLKAQAAIGYVGLAFFLFIFFVVIRNDVMRFVVG
ncbi:MAG: site-2 protease family protein [Coriobacteriales bacterium]|nr:site-2 protease family protein [Coriobacteriales bacterium]